MWLIVGLGNPGNKYLFTRHNIGFMVVDAFLESTGRPTAKSEHQARTYHLTIDDQKFIFAQPQNFMNRSGESIVPLMNYYGVQPDKLVVIHDDIDQVFGSLKIQTARGHGGHNGIRSLHEQLGHNEYARLKMGVGRPPGQMQVADYVLGRFSKAEEADLSAFIARGCDALDSLVFEGFQKAATLFNGLPKEG